MPRALLQKTCIVCGLQKPLPAFLEMTGPQGTLYGNVCSTCRGPGAKSDEKITLPDDNQGTTTTGLRIDADARNLAEMLEKKSKEENELEAKKEVEKRDKKLFDKTERIDLIQQLEKDHRKYLEGKKSQGFMRSLEKDEPTRMAEKQVDSDLFQKSEDVKQDIRNSTLDWSAARAGERADEIRNLHEITSKYRAWLPVNSPILKRLETLMAQEKKAFTEKTSMFTKTQQSEKFSEKKSQENKSEKDLPNEFARNAWPSKKR
jgi:hypothetical protein